MYFAIENGDHGNMDDIKSILLLVVGRERIYVTQLYGQTETVMLK